MKTLIHHEYDVINIICFIQNQNLQKPTENSQRDIQIGITFYKGVNLQALIIIMFI